MRRVVVVVAALFAALVLVGAGPGPGVGPVDSYQWWTSNSGPRDGGPPIDSGIPPDSGAPDSGIPPDSGVSPDSGVVPDGGIVDLAVTLDQSWSDHLSCATETPAYQTSYSGCPTGSNCAFCWDISDGVAEECAEDATDNCSTWITPAVQRWSAAVGRPVAFVSDTFPGTPTSSYTTTNVNARDDTVASAVASAYPNACIWPRALIIGGGGYQMHTGAFSSWSAAVASLRSSVETSLAALSNVCPDWPGTGTVVVIYNTGSHQAVGGADNTWVQHGFSGTFDTYADSEHFIAGQFSAVQMGPDGLHPNAAGMGRVADIFAQSLFRATTQGSSDSLQLTAAAWQSATVLRLTMDVPCVTYGNCEDDPPIHLDTTNLVTQTTQGDVETFGVHFYNSGTLQTPAEAATSVACSAASACTGSSCYCDITFAGDPAIVHDEITVCDTAEGPDGGIAHPGMGGCNLRADTTDTYTSGLAGDWLRGGRVSANSRDGGTPDSGVSDAGAADSGFVPDAMTFSSAESVEFNVSGGFLERAVADPDPLDPRNALTVLAWTQGASLFEPIVSRWGSGGASTETWWIGLATTPGATWAIGFHQGGTGRDCVSGDTNWTQVGFVFDGSVPSLDCYVGGVVSNGSLNGTLGTTVDTEDQNLFVGGTNHTSDVDTLLVFDCALTAAEVQQTSCATHGSAAGACSTAGPGSSSVDESRFGELVLAHPCLVEWCDFEGSGVCWNGLNLSANGTPTYTTAQPP